MKNAKIDLKGMRYGRLVAIESAGKTKSGNTLWLCKCDCGNEVIVSISNLRNGHTKSCGCYAAEQKRARKPRLTHGMSYTRLYTIWQGVKQRCLDENSPAYKIYGAVGITICDEWLNFENFKEWALKNGYKENLTIDRIDNNGIYTPSNCRWITQKEQNRNKKCNHFLTAYGNTRTLGEWREITGIPMSTMTNRINRGLDGEAVLYKGKYPTRKKKK